ncbi:MAG TPA: metallopeptidase TldD-related protein [Thermoanaerobaculia bacterium]|jgi:PmbA protein|nr:metallopeptidase TldD-related protein [Thermoanaerobaculia bacterium]
MRFEDVAALLERRAAGRWELYRKSARTRERDGGRGLSRITHRAEEGWAARWWDGSPAGMWFAAGSDAGGLAAAMDDAARLPAAEEPPPDWPKNPARKAAPPEPAEAADADPPDLAPALSEALAAAGSERIALGSLSLRAGEARERVANAAGLDAAQTLFAFDGVASAIARRGGSARAARAAFRWDPAAPDVDGLARRLAEAASLPLSDRASPFRTGQWLLSPPVAAAVLAAVSPAFCGERGPSWLAREEAASRAVRIVDDASPESAFDGEGVPSRRMLLVEAGEVVARLFDLRTGRAAGRRSTGHGVRPSFRVPPRCGARRIFLEASEPAAAATLAASVRRGLEARALTAPVRVDLAADRYEVEFTGVSIVAGREQGPLGGARASGRISELLRRIQAAGSDLAFFPLPFPAGSPTLLIERTSFD